MIRNMVSLDDTMEMDVKDRQEEGAGLAAQWK